MDVMCNHQLDVRFLSSEKLIKAVDVPAVLHVQSVLVVGDDIHFQVIVDFLRFFDLRVVT